MALLEAHVRVKAKDASELRKMGTQSLNELMGLDASREFSGLEIITPFLMGSADHQLYFLPPLEKLHDFESIVKWQLKGYSDELDLHNIHPKSNWQ